MGLSAVCVATAACANGNLSNLHDNTEQSIKKQNKEDRNLYKSKEIVVMIIKNQKTNFIVKSVRNNSHCCKPCHKSSDWLSNQIVLKLSKTNKCKIISCVIRNKQLSQLSACHMGALIGFYHLLW